MKRIFTTRTVIILMILSSFNPLASMASEPGQEPTVSRHKIQDDILFNHNILPQDPDYILTENDILMHNGSVIVSSGNFYDSGGPDGNYQQNENLVLTFTPQTPGAKINFQFVFLSIFPQYWPNTGCFDMLYVYDGPDINAPLYGVFCGIDVPAALLDFTSTHPTGAITFHFISDDHITRPGWHATFSSILGLNKDLRAVYVSGDVNPNVNEESLYSILIQNVGLQMVEGSEYSVMLKNQHGELISSIDGQTIQPGEFLTFDLPWTPEESGTQQLVAYVSYPLDEHQPNNTSNPYNVWVQPTGYIVSLVGSGNKVAGIPIDFLHHHSIRQTLYFEDEIGVSGGMLSGIHYENNFNAPLENKYIEIYLANTTRNSLVDGWMSFDSLSLVFSGTVDFPAAVNTVFIGFDNPFLYSGRNLMVYVHKPDDLWHSHRFFHNTTDPNSNRTLTAQRMNVPFDPLNPMVIGALSNDFPNIGLYFATAGMAILTGTITDGTIPLEDVKIEVSGTDLYRFTDEQGHYVFSNIPPGTYDVEYSKFAFYTETKTLELEEDGYTEMDIIMKPILQYPLSGQVIAADTQTGIENALVELFGYNYYQTTTDEQGYFVLDNVYENQAYDLKISYPDYQIYRQSFIMPDEPTDMGTIVLQHLAYPPLQVTANADEQQDIMLVSWQQPQPGYPWAEYFKNGIPDNWSRIITNHGSAFYGSHFYHWHIVGKIHIDMGIEPVKGSFQAYVAWAPTHQNEWLITNEFICPPDTDLTFWYYGHDGLQTGDHYYVKVSQDGGNNWDIVWDASALPFATNYYQTPAVIDLSYYAGQNIKIAWNAYDSHGDGLWSMWAIDDITLGDMKIDVRDLKTLSLSDKSVSEPDNRQLLHYKVFRFHDEHLNSQENWIELDNQVHTTEFADHGWENLEQGVYRYAVKAVYTNDVVSLPAFSNVVEKDMEININVVVTNHAGEFIPNASVYFANTSGNLQHIYQGFTNEQGVAYFENLYAGEYNLNVHAMGFNTIHLAALPLFENMTINKSLTEKINAPLNIYVNTTEVPPYSAEFFWDHFHGSMADFRYDDGVAVSQVGFAGGNSSGFIGNVHHRRAELNEISWFATPGSEVNQVNIRILGLTPEGKPNRHNILFNVQNVPSTPNKWNNLILDTPIIAPNGFFIGITSGAGYLGLGLDDGNDEPWEFIPGTQFVIFNININTNEFIDLAVYNYIGNLLLRGHGIDYGPATTAPYSHKSNTPEVSFNVFLNDLENPFATQINEHNFMFNDLQIGSHIAAVQSVYGSGVSELSSVSFNIMEPQYYQLSLTANPAYGGTVYGEGAYIWGHDVDVVASPNTGFSFVNWTNAGGNEISNVPDFTFQMIADDIELTANFTPQTSIDELKNASILLFPNPASNIFYIKSEGLINKVEITDITGRTIYKEKVNNYLARIQHPFESGIFLVKIYTQDAIFVKQLQIQK